MMKVSERVRAAITAYAEEIDRLAWAEVTVKLAGGRVVMVEVTAKHQPERKHGFFIIGPDIDVDALHSATCHCGYVARAGTRELLEARVQQHMDDND